MKKLIMILGLVLMAGLVTEPASAQQRRVKKEVVLVRGKRVKTVNRASVTIVHNKLSYRYYGGVFYKPVGKEFVVVAGPIGFRINTLPSKRIRIRVAGANYFYFNGTFYQSVRGSRSYVVVAPPVGAIVPELPAGRKIVRVNGVKHFELDGYYYKKVVINRRVQFKVVGKIVV